MRYPTLKNNVQEGEGWILNKILERRPRPLNLFMKKHGNKKIIDIQICRRPLDKIVKNLITKFTKVEEVMKTHGYDDLYHLFSVLTLEDGSRFVLEKHHRVMVDILNPKLLMHSKIECIKLPIRFNLTVNNLIIRAEKYGLIYRYSAHENNCQKFLLQLFSINGLMNSKAKQFIMQDAEKLLKPGFLRNIAQIATDTAGVFDTVMRGGEKNECKLPDDYRLRGFHTL